MTTAGTGGSANQAPTSGVTSALGYFAQPIDYDIDRYDLTAAYGNERFQVQLGYTFSNFKDNLTEFDAQNPFNLNPTTTFGTRPRPERALLAATVEFGASGQADAGL